MEGISDCHLGKDATMHEPSELRIWHKLYQVSSIMSFPSPVTHSVLLNSARIGKSQAGY